MNNERYPEFDTSEIRTVNKKSYSGFTMFEIFEEKYNEQLYNFLKENN